MADDIWPKKTPDPFPPPKEEIPHREQALTSCSAQDAWRKAADTDKLSRLGVEFTTEQLSGAFVAFGGIVGFTFLTGFHVVGIALMVLAALSVLVFALHFNEQAEKRDTNTK